MNTNKPIIEEARKMRFEGESVKGIANRLGKAVGTVHGWVKDIEITQEQKKALDKRKYETIIAKTKEQKNRLGWEKKTANIKENYNPKKIGDISVGHILSVFLGEDVTIWMPFGDKDRYDLVIDERGDFIRVQCKTANFYGDKFVFPTCSTNWNTGKKKNYIGEADVFAVYLRENKQVYIFKIENCPKKDCTVRLVSSFRKSTKNYRMAENHLFVPGKSLRDYP